MNTNSIHIIPWPWLSLLPVNAFSIAPYLGVQRRMRYLLTKADMMGNEGGSNPSRGEGRGLQHDRLPRASRSLALPLTASDQRNTSVSSAKNFAIS